MAKTPLITSATRWPVQTFPRYPTASAPRNRISGNCARCSLLICGATPFALLRCNPSTPSSLSCSIHWLTASFVTPSAVAISFCFPFLKWRYRCACCGKEADRWGVDHIIPRSRPGASNRVRNLARSCHDCNQEKGDRTAAEFGYPGVQAHAAKPLKDAAAVNSTRWAPYERLQQTGLPVEAGTGGLTKWNRTERKQP